MTFNGDCIPSTYTPEVLVLIEEQTGSLLTCRIQATMAHFHNVSQFDRRKGKEFYSNVKYSIIEALIGTLLIDINSNKIECRFLGEGKAEYPQGKTPQTRVESTHI